MKVLGIDTSTSCGALGLVEDDEVIAESLLRSSVTHSERLLVAIDSMLKQCALSVDEIDGWAVSLGPGSFTGLRIGLSTVKGLAYGTEKPVLGIPTLDALASQVGPTPYRICPMLDARKKEVYTALYRYDETNELRRVSAYQAAKPQDLVTEMEERTIFLGEGARTYRHELGEAGFPGAIFLPAPFDVLRGSTIAFLGERRLREGKIDDLSTLTPIYVRPSEAELKWRQTHRET